MVEVARILGIDRSIVTAKINFLTGRAAAHMDRDSSALVQKEDRWRKDVGIDDVAPYKAAAATCLLSAAGLSALVEDSELDSASLVRQAADAYWSAGLFFGLALRTIVDGAVPISTDFDALASDWRRYVLNTEIDGDRGAASVEKMNSAYPWPVPQQNYYLSLALKFVSIRDPAIKFDGEINSELRRHKLVPHGPTGTPLSAYLAVIDGANVFRGRIGNEKYRNAQVAFEALYVRQRDAILAAERDEHKWKSLLSPVDVIDFEMVMLTSMLRRSESSLIGWLQERYSSFNDRANAIGLISIEFAERLRESKPGSSPEQSHL
jgi:hypothetical protein